MAHKRNIWWTFAITSTALFMVTLDNLVVTTALPVIRVDLHAGISGLEWTVNAYTLSFAVLLLTGAALGDRFGRRLMFSIGIAIFTLASAAAALAPTIGALDAARAVQGLGGAIVMPLTLTILSAAVPAERRGLALGAWGGISGLAVAFGPVVGGAVVNGISWHWIFWLNVPFGVVLLPLALRQLDETKGPFGQRRPRRARARQRRAVRRRLGTRPRELRRLGHGADRRLARRRRPRARRVRRVGAARGASDAPDGVLPQPDVRPCQRRLDADELRDVRLDLPAGAVLPDGAGLLAARLRAAHPPVDGDADGGRSDRGCPLGPHPGASHHRHGARAAGDRPRMDRGGLVADDAVRRPDRARSRSPGSGMGLFFAPIANVILSSVRSEQEGQASGANNAIRELGGVFGVAILASVFSHYGGYRSGPTFVDGMTPAVYVGAAVVALGSDRVVLDQAPAEAGSGRGGDGLRARHVAASSQTEAEAAPRDGAAGPGQLDPGRDGAAQLAAVAHCDQGGGAGENLPPPRPQSRDDAAASQEDDAEPAAVDRLDHVAAVCKRHVDRRAADGMPRPGVRDNEVANAPPLDPHGDDEADAHADDHSLRRRRGRREQHDRAVVSRPRRECSPRRDHTVAPAFPTKTLRGLSVSHDAASVDGTIRGRPRRSSSKPATLARRITPALAAASTCTAVRVPAASVT